MTKGIEIKSNYENFITTYPVYSAIFKPKEKATITKSTKNKSEYLILKQTRNKEMEDNNENTIIKTDESGLQSIRTNNGK